MRKHVSDYLPEMTRMLKEQLKADELRWGDTWKERPRAGQEKRIIKRITQYYLAFLLKGTPIPWLKVMGEAMIGWIRDVEQEPKRCPRCGNPIVDGLNFCNTHEREHFNKRLNPW